MKNVHEWPRRSRGGELKLLKDLILIMGINP